MSKIIVIDPGHGGSDPGATANGLREKDLTLDIAKRTKKYLDSNYKGHKVHLTRTSDMFLSLSQRARYANNKRADLFVSMHINAGGGTGYETFIHRNLSNNSTTAKRRNSVHDTSVKEMSVTNRGKKKANFAVLRETNMSAILPENLFIDRKEDAKKLKSSSFLDKIAKGHAEGIAKALNLKGGKSSSSSSSNKRPSKPKPKKKVKGRIADIQRWLNTYSFNNIAVDNIAGPDTKKAAVKVYQHELNKQFNAGLTVDGIPGPKTDAAAVVIRHGARGNLTKVLQAFLFFKGYQLSVDGIFGDITYEMVKVYQRKNNLGVDGRPGVQTFKKLIR